MARKKAEDKTTILSVRLAMDEGMTVKSNFLSNVQALNNDSVQISLAAAGQVEEAIFRIIDSYIGEIENKAGSKMPETTKKAIREFFYRHIDLSEESYAQYKQLDNIEEHEQNIV